MASTGTREGPATWARRFFSFVAKLPSDVHAADAATEEAIRLRARMAELEGCTADLRAVLPAHTGARVGRHDYAGVPLTVLLIDPLARDWYGRDWVAEELEEIPILQRGRLRPGARVFDVGAHQCVVAMVLAQKVGPGGFVVALEANGHNARIGALNRDLNGLRQLRVLHAAGAARSGPITITDGYNAQADPDGQGVVVYGYSVDDLSATYGAPDVLFVDVEGFEGQVLAGATETLKRRPDCCIEVHVDSGLEQFGETAQSIIARFPERDYDRYIAGESARIAGAAGRIFAPYSADSPALQERFHLVALARG